jgi:ABC-type transport system substrate-binding protein
MHRLFFILPLRTVARVGVALLTLGAPLAQESPAQRPVRQPIPASGTLRTTPVEDLDKMKQVYNDFKQLEGVLPIPAFPDTINMGTFDPATGTFDSVLTTEHEGASPGGQPHTQIPTVTVNAALVKLHFDLGDNQSGIVVTVNGKSTTVPPRHNSVTIAAGFAQQVHWSLRSGIKFHDGTVHNFVLIPVHGVRL